MDIFLNYLIQFYSNNTTNLRHLTQRIISSYTNKSGDRIVTIDSVTSLQPYVCIGSNDVIQCVVTIPVPVCGYYVACCVELMGEDLPCYSKKIN